jgi:hypothetical protein
MGLGASLGILILGSLAAYILWKYGRRRIFLRQLLIARITPEELKERLDAGERIAIIDVRHPLETKAEPEVIPGAFYLPLESLEKNQGKIPRDREVVLYCS